MRDDYDDDDYDDEEGSEQARKMVNAWKDADRKEENVLRAKELNITLLELHIHDLVEDEIRRNSFFAAASDLEAQEILQRVSQGARR